VNLPVNSWFLDVLSDLFWHPQRILFVWNWKSAFLSIVLRGPIFLAVTVRHGFATTLSAVLAECFVCAVTAGFYGALVQRFRDAKPLWLTGIFLVVVVPAIFQAVEFLVHLIHGTPHLRLAEIISLVVSAGSSLFNWFAMRRGALLVGREGHSFGSDMRQVPKLVVDFVALPWQAARNSRKTA
jgi:hypothetical protein